MLVRCLLKAQSCISYWKVPGVICRLNTYNTRAITTILPMDELHELFLKEWNTITDLTKINTSVTANSQDSISKTKINSSFSDLLQPSNTGMRLNSDMQSYTGELQGNVPHGKGFCVFKNKAIYEGEFAYGECTGKGKFKYPNSTVIEGDFLQNRPEGMCIERWKDGSCYEGNFVKGKWAGVGKLTFRDGTSCLGNWMDGVLSGHDCTVTLRNKIVYKGNLSNYKNFKHRKLGFTSQPPSPTGHGQILYLDNSRYEGEFKRGKRHGYGTSYDSTGKSIYEGKWKNDEPEVTNVRSSSSSSSSSKNSRVVKATTSTVSANVTTRENKIFDTMHLANDINSLNDFNISKDVNNSIQTELTDIVEEINAPSIYTGDLIAGKRQGRGKLVYSNGSVYEGEFAQHQCHGVGRLTAADGTVYDGLWWYGQMYGEGRVIFPNQRIFRGKFLDTEIHPGSLM